MKIVFMQHYSPLLSRLIALLSHVFKSVTVAFIVCFEYPLKWCTLNVVCIGACVFSWNLPPALLAE